MDTEPNHLSFAGEYLGGDASLLISDLLLSDTGEYYCKVKSGGKYHWSQVNLIVLGKCGYINARARTIGLWRNSFVHGKSLYTNTHTHTSYTHRPNHWIISLAHFLCHADWSNDSIWFRQCDLILFVLFGSVWIGLLMRWDQKHASRFGRPQKWLIELETALHGQISSLILMYLCPLWHIQHKTTDQFDVHHVEKLTYISLSTDKLLGNINYPNTENPVLVREACCSSNLQIMQMAINDSTIQLPQW